MRTLSSTLLSAQKVVNRPPLWKVVLSRTGQTTRGYDNRRLLKISRTETPENYSTNITLNNSDKALISLDFEHYQAVLSSGYKTGVTRTAWAANTAYSLNDIRIPTTANGYQYRCSVAGTSHATTEPTWPTDLGVTVTDETVTWEMDGKSGDEYSRSTALRVRVQELPSGIGQLKCILRCIGIADQMKEDKAIAEYTQTSEDTNTVKTLLTAVATAGSGLSGAYNGYSAITVVYDSEDSLIDTFKPADFFSIKLNESRWDKITELLKNTGSKARFENDGKLHIQDIVNTGTTYHYEYKFNVSGDHYFWGKSIRLRFVNPNKETVRTADNISPFYTGNATSATSYALDPKEHTVIGRFTSNAQCSAIASALIESHELDDERGIVLVPPNVGQELWDYVKVTDSRSGDTRVGNVQTIQEEIEIFPGTNRRPTWLMMLSFGKVGTQSLMANLILAGGQGLAGEQAREARMSNDQILMLYDAIIDKLNEVISAQNELYAKVDSLISSLGSPNADIQAQRIRIYDGGTLVGVLDAAGGTLYFTTQSGQDMVQDTTDHYLAGKVKMIYRAQAPVGTDMYG